ncbi:hypothetical protein, partial [Frankia sp. Cr1]|uniref:hypothetical protein n=1 Tax=Frankia sp. Cr1 TaxID=3073931 RepID=UPI002AD426D8
MSVTVPNEVQEAAIKVCGAAFHYRSRLRGVLVSSGVPEQMYERFAAVSNSKYTIARQVFGELENRGPAGAAIQQRIVEELCLVKKPDREAPDQKAGIEAIEDLRDLTHDTIVPSSERVAVKERTRKQETRTQARLSRTEKLAELKGRFRGLQDG